MPSGFARLDHSCRAPLLHLSRSWLLKLLLGEEVPEANSELGTSFTVGIRGKTLPPDWTSKTVLNKLANLTRCSRLEIIFRDWLQWLMHSAASLWLWALKKCLVVLSFGFFMLHWKVLPRAWMYRLRLVNNGFLLPRLWSSNDSYL